MKKDLETVFSVKLHNFYRQVHLGVDLDSLVISVGAEYRVNNYFGASGETELNFYF